MRGVLHLPQRGLWSIRSRGILFLVPQLSQTTIALSTILPSSNFLVMGFIALSGFQIPTLHDFSSNPRTFSTRPTNQYLWRLQESFSPLFLQYRLNRLKFTLFLQMKPINPKKPVALDS
jgi:hypothetical protein